MTHLKGENSYKILILTKLRLPEISFLKGQLAKCFMHAILTKNDTCVEFFLDFDYSINIIFCFLDHQAQISTDISRAVIKKTTFYWVNQFY